MRPTFRTFQLPLSVRCDKDDGSHEHAYLADAKASTAVITASSKYLCSNLACLVSSSMILRMLKA